MRTWAWRRVARRGRKLIANLRLLAGTEGISPENIMWIFGVARTGSTWLSAMMKDLKGHYRWNEPYVGDVFGYAYYTRASDWMRGRKEYVLGDPYKAVWLNSLRTFVLEGAEARFPQAARGGYLVVKEPNGSIGAPLLMEAMPESRMILLVRDPRDVAASLLFAQKAGSWGTVHRPHKDGLSLADTDPDEFVHQRAKLYMLNVGKAKEAYEAHEGRKVLVRYEDLHQNTLKTLKRIYATLKIAVDEEELARVVEKHSWENIPEEQKGPDKTRRKAKPGGWNEDLTSKQAHIVEEITAPILNEFYSA